jgi:alpha-L-arabinofuranosidase
MKYAYLAAICLLMGSSAAIAQSAASIHVNTALNGAVVPTTLHGIFFEEISHAGEGGLYGEMVQNRGFEDRCIPAGTQLKKGWLQPFPLKPHFMLNGQPSDWKMEWPGQSQWPAWHTEKKGNAAIQLSLVTDRPLHTATPHAMQVKVNATDIRNEAALVNEGFWGMNVTKAAAYRLSFFANSKGYTGPVGLSLQTAAGKVLAGTTLVVTKAAGWKKYQVLLTAKGSDPDARLVLSFQRSGTLLLDMVSLFPVHTFRDRPNGMRADLATLIEQMKPAFVRWPGGCYVEGITIESAPDWKTTLGPLETRIPTYSPWGYWSSNGFGYHEYLQFCEDINAAALYVFNAGISCEYRSGTFIPDDSLAPVIQNALDAIEYAIGPVTSHWGKQRAANGHPAPFPLKYVEVGNEQHGPGYAKRYNRFYDAIHAKYPQIGIIANMGIGDVNRHTLDSMQHTDIVDEHAYKDVGWSLRNFDHFDQYKRGHWQMYVGEYATNAGVGHGNLRAALSDAVYVMSMEKNGDLVNMSSYAPLLVNEHDVDWPVNLIHFNAATSFGRISYYALNMLNEHKATVNFPVSTDIQPETTEQPRFAGGIGLATWDAEAQYKDIVVVQNKDTVYNSNAATGLKEWLPVRGSWQQTQGIMAQTAEGAQQLALLKDHHFNAYTLTLKARKTGGVNAFIIPFAVKDTNTCLRVHIGSWLNSHAVFESLTNGYDVAGISNPVRLEAPLVSDRWYNIRLEVGNTEAKCYIDDSLLMTYREPQQLFTIAGKDEKSGDIILKIVNAGPQPVNADIHLDGAAGVYPVAQVITLTADTPESENSFAQPVAYVPHTTTINNADTAFNWTVPPLSVNIIRLKQSRVVFNVSMPVPGDSIYLVEMKYRPDTTAATAPGNAVNNTALLPATTTLQLPVWTPGYYQQIMRTLYRQYYQQLQRGFTSAEFRQTCEAIAGESLADFFVYAETVAPINYPAYLRYAGLTMDKTGIHLAPAPDELQQEIRVSLGVSL